MHVHVCIHIFVYMCMCVCICIHTYTMEYYSAIRKDDVPPFVTMWMDLENIMLSEIRAKVKNHMISLMWDIKLEATNEQTRNK